MLWIFLIWNSISLESAFQNFIFFKFYELQKAWNKIDSTAWRQSHTAEYRLYTFHVLAELCSAFARPLNAASSTQCAGRDHLENHLLPSWGSCAVQSPERDRLSVLSSRVAHELMLCYVECWGIYVTRTSLSDRILLSWDFHSVSQWLRLCLSGIDQLVNQGIPKYSDTCSHPALGLKPESQLAERWVLTPVVMGGTDTGKDLSLWKLRPLKCFCFSAAWRNCIAYGSTCWTGGSGSLPPEEWGPGWCPSQGRCFAYNGFLFLLKP